MQVTDGGLETDLIFRRGVDLPEFAAFPLLDDEAGRDLLTSYYADYFTIARQAGAALLLETPTWRANPEWGALIGYDDTALAWVNEASIDYLHALIADWGPDEVTVSGTIGPRSDGYRPGSTLDPDEAAEYHDAQVAAFAAAGADAVAAYTLTDPGEAIGIVRAARSHGLPVAVSFTIETDGGLASGHTLAQTVATVDAAAAPDFYLVNCAHPDHVAAAVADGGLWLQRIHGLRCNASRRSHAELDAADDLDDGDPAAFASDHAALRSLLPNLSILGGCCGTDARHVASLWGVPTPT